MVVEPDKEVANISLRLSTDEPKGLLISDLCILAAGVAFSIALEQNSELALFKTWNSSELPGWLMLLSYTWATAIKLTIAFIPVILARKIRYGGLLNSSEFLALFVGTTQTLISIQHIPSLGLIYPSSSIRANGESYKERLFVWMLAYLLVTMSAACVGMLFRRRLAPWILGCLTVALFMMTLPLQHFVMSATGISKGRWNPSIVSHWIFFNAICSPFDIIANVPVVLVAYDFSRRNRPQRTWIQTASAVFGLTSFFTLILIGNIKTWIDFKSVGQITFFIVRLMRDVLSISIAVILVRRFAGPFTRWIGLEQSPQVNASVLIQPN